jgi:cytosine/uracil/thiamine/allantoin permease
VTVRGIGARRQATGTREQNPRSHPGSGGRGIHRYPNGVNPRAILALAAAVLVALPGLLIPSLRFLFGGAWFPATLVAFAINYALMRPATAADARLTLVVPEIR